MPEAAHAERSRSSRRKRLRLGVFLLLFLIGGAIVNVAVAWGASLYSTNQSLRWVKSEAIWASKLPSGYHIRTDNVMRADSFGLTHFGRMLKLEDLNSSNLPDAQQVVCAGWPFRALWMQCVTPSLMTEPTPKVGEYWMWPVAQVNGYVLPQWIAAKYENNKRQLGFRSSYVPIIPVWPGFAINTIFYAAILALLFYGPGKVRRMIRIHRSQCPACGHIIASGTCANGLCSECGSPLPKGFKPKPQVSAKT